MLVAAGAASSFGAPDAAAAKPKNAPLSALGSGDVSVAADQYEFDGKSGIGHGVGNVHVTSQGLTLDADEATYDNNTGAIKAHGNVVVSADRAATIKGVAKPGSGKEAPPVIGDGKTVWRADEIVGNLRTRQFEVGHYKGHSGPLYMEGKSASVTLGKDGKTVIKGGDLTTCDLADKDEPHYKMTASRITYYQDGNFTAWNVRFNVGRMWIPVFWLPGVWGSTNSGAGIEVKPGYNGRWGAFLLLSKQWKLSENVTTTMHLDLRSRNGLALGNETRITTEKTETDAILLGMDDMNTPTTSDGYNRRFAATDLRYRAKVYHRENLADGLTLRAKVDKMSDIDMMENWFGRKGWGKNEYRTDPQPKTFADVTLDSERYSLSFSARKSVNDFWSEVEQLPLLKFDMPRQPLGDSGFYYEGHSSVGKMKMSWRRFDVNDPLMPNPEDYSALRADSLHMFYYPLQLNELEIVPRAGGRVTYYDKSSQRRITVNDLDRMMAADDPDQDIPTVASPSYDSRGGSVMRLAAETGVEVSSKFYRTWSDYKSQRWNIDGLRHVVQPYANYTFAPSPSQDRDNLYFFDELDRLIEQNFIRFGLRQRWETRRSNRIYTLASLENYADFHFARGDGKAGPGGFGTVFRFDPREDFGMWTNAVVDMGAPTLNRGEVGFGIGDKKVLRTELSYLYRSHYTARSVYSMGSSLTDPIGDSIFAHEYDSVHYICLGFLFPINAKVNCELRTEFDIVDKRLARQMIEFTRDLHCWTGGLRFEYDDGGGVGVMVILTLKAFPGFQIKSGM